MPDTQSTKSKDESLRQIVEKNLAKEQIKKKVPKLKKFRITGRKPKKNNIHTKKKTFISKLLTIFKKFIKLMFSPISEMRLVTWPNYRITLRLTSAVVLFSVIFGVLISILDWGFEIVFKKVFLHG